MQQQKSLILWPESQEFMELEGWPDEYGAELISDEDCPCSYSIDDEELKRAVCDIMNKRTIERLELIKDGKYSEC